MRQQAIDALESANLTAKHLAHANGATYDAWVKKLSGGSRRLTLDDLKTVSRVTLTPITIDPHAPDVQALVLLGGEPATRQPPERPASYDEQRNRDIYLAYRWGVEHTSDIAEAYGISAQRVRQIAAAEQGREEKQETS